MRKPFWSWDNTLQRLGFRRAKKAAGRKPNTKRRMACEALEPREMLSLTIPGLRAVADTVVVTMYDSLTVSVSLNGGTATPYTVPGDGIVILDCAAGTDTVTITGTSSNESANLASGGGTIYGSAYQIQLSNAETVTVNLASGSDSAVLTGTSTAETWSTGVADGTLWDSTYSIRIRNTESVEVHGGAGSDTAKLYDSTGDDTFTAEPGEGEIEYANGTTIAVDGFEAIHAYGTAGGNDTAYLNDSAGNDTLYADGSVTNAAGDIGDIALWGTGHYSRAKFFESVTAYATAGGNDTASLYDGTTDDLFVSWDGGASLADSATTDPAFSYRAEGFDTIDAYANNGGLDSAKLYDSTGTDTFTAEATEATLSIRDDGVSSEQVYTTHDFEGVNAYASAGGEDTALLRDSSGNDTGYVTSVDAILTGTNFYNRAKFFETATLTATSGTDTANFYDSTDPDLFEAYSTYATIDFNSSAGSMMAMSAVTTAPTGAEVALAKTAATKENSSASNKELNEAERLWKIAFESWKDYLKSLETKFNDRTLDPQDFFEKSPKEIAAAKQTEGEAEDESLAYQLTRATQSDSLLAAQEVQLPSIIAMSSGTETWDVKAEYFDSVHAFGTTENGGVDTANLYDTTGNDTFVARLYEDGGTALDDGALLGTGYYNRAKAFEQVNAYATGGTDTAQLWGDDATASITDGWSGGDNWVQWQNATRCFVADDFDYVQASTAGVGTLDVNDIADVNGNEDDQTGDVDHSFNLDGAFTSPTVQIAYNSNGSLVNPTVNGVTVSLDYLTNVYGEADLVVCSYEGRDRAYNLFSVTIAPAPPMANADSYQMAEDTVLQGDTPGFHEQIVNTLTSPYRFLKWTGSADINDDGCSDLVTITVGDGNHSIDWYEWDDASGTLTENNITTGDGEFLESCDFADMDNDGDLDIVAIRIEDSDYKVCWYENGNNFIDHTWPISMTMGGDAGTHVADIDGDGDLDVVSYCSDIIWHENISGGLYNPRTIAAYPAGNVHDCVDMNGDGRVDIVARYSWYENVGLTSFIEHDYPSFTEVVETGDLDGDGDMDLVVADGTNLIWRENDGLGDFTSHTITTPATSPTLNFNSLQVVDLDGDGDNDLAAVSGDALAWYENDGDQEFKRREIGIGGRFVHVADITGDNHPDVLYSIIEGGSQHIVLEESYSAGVLANDIDPHGDALSATLISGPAYGTVSLNTDGTFTYTPNPDYVGTDSFTYRAYDADSISSVAEVTIEVEAVNDAPVITFDGGGATASVHVTENSTHVADVTAEDVDGDELTYSITGGADQGKFTIVTTETENGEIGVISFIDGQDYEMPTDANADGIYEVEVTVSDGELTDVQVISVTVDDANIEPVNFSANGDQLVVTYDLVGTGSEFGVEVYRSSDGVTLDQLLYTTSTDPTGLAAGTHQFAFTPAFENDVDEDYVLIACLTQTSWTGPQAVEFAGGVFIEEDGTVQVHGTDAADNVSITADGILVDSVSSVPYEVDVPMAPVVFVRTHAGDDTVTVASGLATTLHVYAGEGDDTVIGAKASDVVDGGAGSNSFDGDSDFDGLLDSEEIEIYGTDPFHSDTDGDLLPDGFEALTRPYQGLDPLEWNDPTGDRDGDAVSNLAESVWGTRPDLVDTDGDGVSDGDEILRGSNPLEHSDFLLAAEDEGQMVMATMTAAQTTDTVSVKMTVGDESGSDSELWRIVVGTAGYTAPGRGDSGSYTESKLFKRGGTYPVHVVWAGSKRLEPDYDYRADLQLGSEETWQIVVKDPDNLLAIDEPGGDTTENVAANKTATLYIPDPDIDILVDGSELDESLDETQGWIIPTGVQDSVKLKLQSITPSDLEGEYILTFPSCVQIKNGGSTVTSGITSIPAGEAKELTVTGLTEGVAEITVEFIPTGYTLATSGWDATGSYYMGTATDTVKLTIGNIVTIAAVDANGDPASHAMEGGDSGAFTIERTNYDSSSPALPVQFQLKNLGGAGVATPAADFTFSAGVTDLGNNTYQVTIPAGEGKVTFSVNPVDDQLMEPQINWHETVEAELLDYTGYTPHPGKKSDSVRIQDNDRFTPIPIRGTSCACAPDFTADSSGGYVTANMLCMNYVSSASPVISFSGMLDADLGTPASVTASLTFGGQTGQTVYYDNPEEIVADDFLNFSLIADTSGLSAGHYTWEATLTVTYDTHDPQTQVYTGEYELASRDDSPIGQGWSVGPVDRLEIYSDNGTIDFHDDVTWVAGTGSIIHFASNGDGTYEREWGDTTASTLSWNDNGTPGDQTDDFFTLTSKDGSTAQFNDDGLLVFTRDSNGNQTDFTYVTVGGQDAIQYIEYPDGSKTTYEYGVDNKLATIKKQFFDGDVDHVMATITRTTTVGGSQMTVTQSDPDGSGSLPARQTIYDYDGTTGLITSITVDGETTQFEYDFTGRVEKVVHPDGTEESFVAAAIAGAVDPTTNDVNNPAPLMPATNVQGTQTDALGQTQSFTADALGNTTSETIVIDGTEYTTYYEADVEGRVVRKVEPDIDGDGPRRELITEYAYDSRGNLTNAIYAKGTVDETSESWEYDAAFSRVTRHVDTTGRVTKYILDSEGNIASTTQVVGLDDETSDETNDITTSYTYGGSDDARTAFVDESNTPAGLLVTETDALGIVTLYTYNDRRLVTMITRAVGTADESSVSYEYDGRNNLTAVIDELGFRTEYVYDSLNRLIKTISPYPNTDDAKIVDDGDTAFSTEETWTSATDAAAYGGDYLYASGGAGANTATWSFDGLVAGQQYEVLITWKADAANSTAAPITIVHGGVTQDLITVDQTVDLSAADDAVTVDGHTWQSIFRFTAVAETVTVQLSDNTTGQVVADGVCVLQARAITETIYDASGNVWKEIDATGEVTQYQYDSMGRVIRAIAPDPDGNGPLPSPATEYVYDAAGQLVNTVETTYVSDEGLVGYWKFDENDGTTAVDSSGSGNDGTLVNMDPATDWVTGFTGNSLHFDSSNDTVTINNLAVDTTAGAHNTVSFWMKWDGGNGEMPVGWEVGYDLFLYGGFFGFNTGESNVLGMRVADIPGGLVNRWVHVTAVFYNGVPSADTVKLYVDGQLMEIEDCYASYPTTVSRSVTEDLWISGWGSNGGYKFGGSLDEVRVYNRELSADEVAALADARVTRYEYDSLGRQTTVTLPDPDGIGEQTAPTSETVYNALNQVVETIDALGNVTKYEYDWQGQLTRVTSPDPDGYGSQSAPVTEYIYDATGRLVAQIDSLGNVTEYVYDELGRQTKVLSPYPNLDNTTIVDNGDPEFTFSGTEWTHEEYDPETDTLGNHGYQEDYHYASGTHFPEMEATATWTFNGLTPGQQYEILLTWEPNDVENAPNASFIVYDGTTSGSVFDGVSPVDQTVAPGNHAILGDGWYTLGRFIVSGNTLTVKLTSDGADGIVIADAVKLVESCPVSETVYDAAGQVVQTIDSLGAVTQYMYDSLGRQTRVIQPDPDNDGPLPAHATEYVYDAAGRLVTTTETEYYTNDGLVGYWKLDEDSGVVASDSSGNGNDGTLINMDPATDWEEGYIGNALEFERDNDTVEINNLSVDTTAGAHNTVSFWMNWNGIYNEMPLGWDCQYDLWFSDGFFGFNTGTADILGISVSDVEGGMANRWVHVAAVFYNGVPSTETVKLYINGQLMPISQKMGSTTQSRSVTEGLVLSGWGDTDNYKFGGALDEVRVYSRELISEEIAEIVKQKQRVIQNEYDALGRVTKIIGADPDGDGAQASPETTYTYNILGQVLSTTDPLGKVTKYEYDALGRQTKVIEPDPDDDGPLPAPVTEYTYDVFGQLAKVTKIAEPSSEGLLLHLKLDEASGELIAQDSSICDHDGTLVNFDADTAWVAGQDGNALAFDGTDDIVTTDIKIDQSATSAGATFAAWVKPTGDGTSKQQVISTDNGGCDWSMFRYGSQWCIFNGVTATQGTGASVDLDTWQHIAVVFDPTTNTSYFYKNGVLVASFGLAFDTATSNLAIGENPSGSWTEAFAGFIDDARVYQRPLTAEEIQLLVNSQTQETTYQYDNLGQLIAESQGTQAPSTAVEQLGEYEVSDPNSRLTIDGSEVSYSGVTRNEDTYVYKDFGEDYFDGDFEHFVEMTCDSSSGNWAVVYAWALANRVDDATAIRTDATEDWLGVGFYQPGNLQILLQAAHGGNTQGAAFVAQHDTTYYLRIVRDTADGTANGTLSCYIYSDAEHTNLLDTLSLELKADVDFQYLYALQSVDSDYYNIQSGTFRNLSIGAPTTRYTYDAAGQLTSETDPAGNVTQYEYDALGRVTNIIEADPDGAAGPQTNPVTTYTYDAAGQVTAVTDPLGNVTRYLYDNLGRQVTVLHANSMGDIEIGATNNGITATDGATDTGFIMYSKENVFSRFAASPPYSGSSDHLVVVRYDGSQWFYDNNASLVAFTPEDSDVLIAEVDLTNDTITSLEGVWEVEHGIAKGYATGDLNFTADWYNGEENDGEFTVEGTCFVHGSKETYYYNTLGQLIRVDDPESNSTVYEYDNLGRLVSQTNAENETTTYTYDAFGNRLSLTDAEQNTTTWVYDNLNRAVEEANELGDTRYFTYNAGGYLTRRVDRRGLVREYEYDNLGQNTVEIWYDSVTDADADQNRQNTLSFSYDTFGQLITAGDTSATYDFDYDALGRVTEITQNIAGLTSEVIFTQEYDAAGQRTRLAATVGGTADFVTDYVYDALGQIDSIKQYGTTGGNAVAEKYVDFAFDATGRADSLNRYADLAGTDLVAETDYLFDHAGRLTDLTHSKGATTLADYDFGYDLAGQLLGFDFTSLVGDDGDADYTYDATGQLVDADYDADWQTDEGYVYDDNGNRVTANGASYTTGDNNQLLADGTYAYTYDEEGNRTARFVDNDSDGELSSGDTDVTEYEWDHRNRLVKVTTRDTAGGTATQIVEYAYDYGQRWGRKVLDANGDGTADASTVFVYDGNQIVQQFDHAGTGDATAADLSHRYLWGTATDQALADEQISSPSTAGETLWLLGDHLNSVRDAVTYDAATDTTTIRIHRVYDAFGNLTSEQLRDSSNTTVTAGQPGALRELLAYTARPFDLDTSLQNNLNRWYDAAVGRWLSEDPIGFDGSDENLYRYVANAPTMYRDYSGLTGVRRSVGAAYRLISTVLQTPGSKHVVVQKKGTGGNLMGTLNPNVVSLGVLNLGDLEAQIARRIDTKPPKCECIGVLEIMGHSHGGRGIQIGESIPTGIEIDEPKDIGKKSFSDKDLGRVNFMTDRFAEEIGDRLKKLPFCSKSVIVLNACNSGNKKTPPDLPSILKAKTGAIIIATGGFSKVGRSFAVSNPLKATIEKYLDDDKTTYHSTIDAKDAADYHDSENDTVYISW